MLKINPYKSGACQSRYNCPYKNAGKTIHSDDSFCNSCGCAITDAHNSTGTPWWLIIAISLMIFAGIYRYWTKKNTPPPPIENSESTTSADVLGDATSFRFQPPLPVGGKLKGIVELGSESFTYFIIYIDRNKNWKKEKALWDDVAQNHTSPLIFKFSPETAEEEIENGLKRYIRFMLNYGVDHSDIHFVVSSGAQKTHGNNLDRLTRHLNRLGYRLNLISATQEAELAYLATVPESLRAQSFLVDIGSGNSKISWQGDSRICVGSKYHEQNTSDAAAIESAKTAASDVPAQHRNLCFIIGGVPYEFAKQHRNQNERYTLLRKPDDYQAQGKKQHSGLVIYKTIAETTGCQQFVFDWDASFSIGFLLSLPF